MSEMLMSQQNSLLTNQEAGIISKQIKATISNKKSKYLYLGKAGSAAHINAVEQVTRRSIIDELERVINSLQESYLDVYFGGESEPDMSYYTN